MALGWAAGPFGTVPELRMLPSGGKGMGRLGQVAGDFVVPDEQMQAGHGGTLAGAARCRMDIHGSLLLPNPARASNQNCFYHCCG